MKPSFKTKIGLTAATIIMSMLSACATELPHKVGSEFQHPIQIAESVERLELYTRSNGLQLSARDQGAVDAFIRTYSQHGEGPLYINIPSNSAAGLGTQQAQALIQQSLARSGGGQNAIQTGQYQVAAYAPAPVVVSYRRLKTIPHKCGHLGSMTATGSNEAYPGYGCWSSANLAAMIENPRQLIEPYGLTSPDSQRRMTVYDKYIAGENPASILPDRQDLNAETE